MKKVLKWSAAALGVLVGLTLLAGVALHPIGMKKLTRTFPGVSVEQVAIPTDAGALARGKHAATIWGCIRCHGDNLAGSLMTHDPIDGYVPLLATIPASNLTSGEGGIAGSYTDRDWVRAIRHGVKPGGQVELFMYDYSTMSDRDLGDLIAYLKQLPPVDAEQPAASYGPLLPAFVAVGVFTPVAERIDHNAPRPAEPVPGATREYGKYLSALCSSCHGGGLVQPVHGSYSRDGFARAVRTGILPSGTEIGRAMPPRIYGELNDTELAALWLYLENPPLTQTR